MKTKLLAMMLLAGGSMFAQTRFSIGINLGGHEAGFYQTAPRYDNRFGDNDDRQGFARGDERNRLTTGRERNDTDRSDRRGDRSHSDWQDRR